MLLFKTKAMKRGLPKWFRITWNDGNYSIFKAKSKQALFDFLVKEALDKETILDRIKDVEQMKVSDSEKAFHGLTVGELRKTIKDLPDDMHVYYQRIEDYYFKNNNWHVTPILWEFGEYSEYIRAFGSYVHDGKLAIHAHY